jgi:hypothetical protein
MDAVNDRLLRKLRQLAPHKVRVLDGSDTARDVAVPHGRKRWSAVLEVIEAMPWVRCELMDKTGAILGYVDNDAAATELEDLASGTPSGAAEKKWFLDTMIKAQREALTWRDKEHTETLAAMREILQVNAHATRELVELFRVQRDVSADIAAMRAAAENGDDMDKIVKILEASPKLMQMLGPMLMGLRGKVAKPAKPATPNGVKS